MDDFKILEEIGLKEVSNSTHIEVKYLEYMINKEFDKLNKSTTVGFVKILSREYKLDLTEWLNDAQRYWNENSEDIDKTKIFIVQKNRDIRKYILPLFLLAVLVCILYGAYIFLDKKLDFFETPLVNSDKNYTYEDTPVVNEAKVNIDENITIAEMDKSSSIDDVQKDGDDDEPSSLNSLDTDESNDSSTLKSSENNISLVDENETTKLNEPKETLVGESYILPRAKLWLGVIYLDNFKRKSFLGRDKFELDISRDQLITTGHGKFSLQINGVTQKFNSQNPIRLLIKDGRASVISAEKFKELNRGSIW